MGMLAALDAALGHGNRVSADRLAGQASIFDGGFGEAEQAVDVQHPPIATTEFDELVLYLRRTLELTIVMVTHDLDTLSRTCDRVAVLVDGKVIVDTLPRIQNHEHPWIREYFHGPRGRREAAAGKSGGA